MNTNTKICLKKSQENLDQILRLLNLQLQRQHFSSLGRFKVGGKFLILKTRYVISFDLNSYIASVISHKTHKQSIKSTPGFETATWKVHRMMCSTYLFLKCHVFTSTY
jgi:hypothetical protein